MNKNEIKKQMDQVYEEYRFSKERAENVDTLRRKHTPTAKELARRFTI
jgi:hypothetical protein